MQVALGRAQDVLVVLIERIDRPRLDLEGLPRRHIDDLTFTGDAVVGLEMILVVEMTFGAFENSCLVNRVTHSIVADDHPLAVPAGTGHMAGGVGDVCGPNDEHAPKLLNAASIITARSNNATSPPRLPVNIKPIDC